MSKIHSSMLSMTHLAVIQLNELDLKIESSETINILLLKDRLYIIFSFCQCKRLEMLAFSAL